MGRFLLVIATLFYCIASVSAQERDGSYELADDRFIAKSTAVHDTLGADDLFMFGETVRSEQDIAGSAHLFGRRVLTSGEIGRDAYIAGMDVTQQGKVIGDLTISGYTVHVGEVAGDLRASAANLVLSGPVSGYAIVAAEKLEFKADVKGDVSLTAGSVEFSEGAKIGGTLVVYEAQPGDLEIPSRVAPADRVERRDMSEWSDAASELELWSWRNALGEFLVGVLMVAVIAAIIAAIVPQKLADLRRRILDQPFRSLLVGFLGMSTLLGLNIVLLITGIGLLLLPLSLFITAAAVFGAYVVGAYAVGVAILLLANQAEPSRFATRALAAGLGAFAAAIVGVIPFLGWLLVLAITFAGLGSLVAWLFRPTFFSND